MPNTIYSEIDMDLVLESLSPEMRMYVDSEKEIYRGVTEPGYYVLELGCGTGRILEALSPHCKRLVGVDNSELQLNKAEVNLDQYHNIELYQQDARDLRWLDEGEFDLVLGSWNFLGIVDDKVSVLKEAHRVLKNNSHMLFSVYAENALLEQLKCYLGVGLNLLKRIDDYSVEISDGNGVQLCSERFDQNRIRKVFLEAGFGNIAISRIAKIAYVVDVVKGEVK